MFPLHDRTRRLICRTLFVLFGVLPTTAVLGWSLSMQSAGQLSAVRAKLEAALGLKVQIAKVSFPRPGATLLEGLELSDFETGQTIAASRLVEITNDSHGETIFASQPEIDAAATSQLKALIATWLRRPITSQESTVQLSSGELTLRWPGGAQTFVDCGVRLQTTPEGNIAEAAFRSATSADQKPIHLLCRRTSRADRISNSFKIEADDVPLPFSLITVLTEQENHCGPHSTLQGTLNATETPDGWQAEFAGQIENIDLHSLVSQQFPHQLSGKAELMVSHVVMHAGRLEEAKGILHAGPGSVSTSLLTAAAAMLGLTRGGIENSAAPPDRNANTSPYEELAAEFTLDDSGFSLHGQCGGKPNGVVMRRGEEVLLAESGRGAVPIVALVKMLVPDSRVQVPATRQTDPLLNLLPVPDVVPGDPQAVPHARLRGGKDLH